jgi:hypothetical protein
MPRLAAGERFAVRSLTSSLGFTGGTTFGQITANTALNTLGNGTNFWTYTVFLHPRNISGGIVRLAGKNDSGGAKYPFALRLTAGGLYESVIFNGTTSVARATNRRLDDGNWHRVLTLYLQTSNTITVYADDALDGSSSGAVVGADQSNTGDIYVGRRNAETPSFRGRMQTFAVGQGTLSATDISNLMRKNIMPAGTLINIPHSDGSGNTAVDVSGNANNEAITSPAWSNSPFIKARSIRP